MAYRNGNYCAFYVDGPFNENDRNANTKPDFCHYRMLQAWKAQSPSFPFIDSHDKNYNVRDSSDWESTLKPRLRERLRNSKNIILFLSSHTKPSCALTEEINYGVGELKLPVIVVYPELDYVLFGNHPSIRAENLWPRLPAFKNLMRDVPVAHVPMKKQALWDALSDPRYMLQR